MPGRPWEQNIHCESTCRNRHGSQKSRPNTLPETTEALCGKGLLEAVGHAAELLLRTEAIGLHLALHHVEGVAGQPESLSRETTVGSNANAGDLLTVDVVSLRVQVHQVLEGQEPNAVRLGLSQNSNHLASEETFQDTLVSGQLADTVQRAAVEPTSSVRLGL